MTLTEKKKIKKPTKLDFFPETRESGNLRGKKSLKISHISQLIFAILKEKAALSESCFIPQIQYRDNARFTLSWFLSLHLENVSFKNLGKKNPKGLGFCLSCQVLIWCVHFSISVLSQSLSQTPHSKIFFSSFQKGNISIYICNSKVWSTQQDGNLSNLPAKNLTVC